MRKSLQFALAILLCTCTTELFAAVKPAPTPPAPVKQKTEKEKQEEAYQKILSDDGFKFPGMGKAYRDPFTAVKKKAKKEPIKTTDDGHKEDLDDFYTKLKNKQKVVDKLLKEGRYAQAIELCTKAIEEIKNKKYGGKPFSHNSRDETLKKVIKVYERFLNRKKSAEYHKRRKEVQAEFAGLQIAIQGIVWSYDRRAAIINGLSYRELELMRGLEAKIPPIQIIAIERKSIIFLYKGYKVELKMRQSQQGK